MCFVHHLCCLAHSVLDVVEQAMCVAESVVSRMCWGVVPLGVGRPTCCALLEALLLLSVCCVCWKLVLRQLC